MAARLTVVERVVRLLGAIALLSLAFAHQPVMAAGAFVATARSVAYILPDGTYATLCINEQATDTLPVGKPGCEVCRLSAGIVLPVPDMSSWLACDPASLDNTRPAAAGVRQYFAVVIPRSRAPPVPV